MAWCLHIYFRMINVPDGPLLSIGSSGHPAPRAPRLLLYYRSEEHQHRAPGIPDRFSAAADAAHNTCILTISPVQPEDDADYYCFVGDLF